MRGDGQKCGKKYNSLHHWFDLVSVRGEAVLRLTIVLPPPEFLNEIIGADHLSDGVNAAVTCIRY
jgi:hypothetical protein